MITPATVEGLGQTSLSGAESTKQMEWKLNFQVPAEGLELLILLHTQYWALRHHKLIINDDSHPQFFLSYINPICPSFFIKSFLKIFTFEKNLNFSEKMPTEGLELLILLHTQYWALRHLKIFKDFHFWKKSQLFWKNAHWIMPWYYLVLISSVTKKKQKKNDF